MAKSKEQKRKEAAIRLVVSATFGSPKLNAYRERNKNVWGDQS